MVIRERILRMNDLNETKALGIMFSSTKRKNRINDLITIAQSCEYLINLYGSRKKVADILGISTEMIRQFVLPLKLPKLVQDLISDRKIDSIDVIMHLNSLKNPNQQIKAAQMITDVSSKDVRDIIKLVKKYNIDIDESINTIIQLKTRSMHIVMLDIEDDSYNILKEISNEINIPPAIITKVIVESWLREHKKNEAY